MKVKIRKIMPPFSEIPTESLQAILRNHAANKLHLRINTNRLYDIMEELARRRDLSGKAFRSNEEAWSEFRQHYWRK